MASPIGSQGTFAIKTDDRGSSINIRISESAGVKAENLSLSTWGASYVLANLLHNIKTLQYIRNGENPEQLSALELGAGTGLVGLSAAAIWKCKVTLTDLPPILPGLAANTCLNKTLVAMHAGSISCGSLDWAHPQTIITYPSDTLIPADYTSRPSIILAADTIYTPEHPLLLSNTIRTWLASGPHSRAILCYPLRMAYIDHVREFWELMEAGGLECIEEGREEGREEWNEVAGTNYEWCAWAWRGVSCDES